MGTSSPGSYGGSGGYVMSISPGCWADGFARAYASRHGPRDVVPALGYPPARFYFMLYARTLRGVTDTAESPDTVTPPRTVNLAFVSLIAYVAVSVGNAALLWGFTDYLRHQFVTANNKLEHTAKHTDKN